MSLPEPYYQDNAVTIYHGDCREILPHLPKVDAVVTDPPYGVSMKRGDSKVSHAIIGDNEPFSPSHLLQWPCVLNPWRPM